MDKNTYDKNKSVCFTGHRFIPFAKSKEIRKRLREEIVKAYNHGFRNFYCGMACGFDMMAASVVLSLQCDLHDISLFAVIPFRDQTARWSERDRERYNNLLAAADGMVVLSERYFPGCLLRRNDYMIEHSSSVIAYYDGDQKGGTAYTCRRAKALNMEIRNIF